MKKFVLALALVLSMSTCAMAEKITCKSTNGTEFTVQVPEGWAWKELPGGCVVAKKDGTELISVAYYPASGADAKTFAQAFIQKMQVTPKFNEQKSDYVDFDATVNGQELNFSITGKSDDSELQVVTQKGESETLEKIFDSVTF